MSCVNHLDVRSQKIVPKDLRLDSGIDHLGVEKREKRSGDWDLSCLFVSMKQDEFAEFDFLFFYSNCIKDRWGPVI